MVSQLKEVLHSVKANTFIEVYTLAEKTSYVNTQNCYGETALIYAAATGNKALVDGLLHNGSRINHQDNEGRTALHWAVDKGHLEIVLLLTGNRSNVNIPDGIHKTPLILAVENNRPEIAEHLLKIPEIRVDHRDHGGNTALHWAVNVGSKSLVKLLLQHKAQVNIQNNFGSTPLIWAAKNGNNELTQLLLTHKADINIYDNLERNALMRAIENNHRQTAEILLNHFNISRPGIRKQIDQASNFAKIHGHADLAVLIREKIKA